MAEAMVVEVKIPDIGGATDVDVIEVMVASGNEIAVDDSLITLESDKASMEIPSPHAGIVKGVKITVGDKVSENDVILTMEMTPETAQAPTTEAPPTPARTTQTPEAPTIVAKPQAPSAPAAGAPEASAPAASAPAASAPAASAHKQPSVAALGATYASPSIRRFARELGVDLSKLTGTGRKGRVQKSDVTAFVKATMAGGVGGGGLAIAAMPQIDFSKFGSIELKSLTKIKRLTGTFLHRNWVSIPHVTQVDEADITELEAFRKNQKKAAEAQGVRLTILAFIMKAVVSALQKFPQFNSSLDAAGENLILKHYYHIGVAVDTPKGLVVPVIRDVGHKGALQLAKELGEISTKARGKGLSTKDMEGGTFTISSLGGISGLSFTPIVNAPEVAILGVSRSAIKPVYLNGDFAPRLMLPLSLSYDHRVIDGAEGARFTRYLSECLADARHLLL